MESSDLFVMLAGVLFVGFLVYKNIEKINLEESSGTLNRKKSNARGYELLCDSAINELVAMKNGDESFDEGLDDFVRELRGIKSMNQNSDDSVWSAKLGGIFMRIDEYLREQGKELLANALQNKLKSEFEKI